MSQLNSRVSIECPEAGTDAVGQPLSGWLPVATVWANVLFPNGAESVRAGAEVSTVKASVRIQRRADVTAAMRIRYGQHVLLISAVLPESQDRRYTDLVCEMVK